ncbi:MAG: hypothetical protein QM723_22415 [Myxococcaceae bacterium]
MTGLRTRPFALFALLALAGGTVVLPVAHQFSHQHAHSHGEAEALVFDAGSSEAHGPHGGLLLHPKPASKKHTHAPLSHGKNSVEHYGVAVALAAPAVVTLTAPEAVEVPAPAPVEVHVDTSYLCSPLQPGAPPA